MRRPVVLTEDEVAVELVRLCGDLRAARLRWGSSTRQLAEFAGVSQATVYRIEHARTRPTYLLYARLAALTGVTIDLDDGTSRARQERSASWPLPTGYRYRAPVVYSDWDEAQLMWTSIIHRTRVRLGAELWWARNHELDAPLNAQDACRLLDISHHTLAAVEFGPDWPDLASIVRVAGLTGRRVVLIPEDDGVRLPHWAADGPG